MIWWTVDSPMTACQLELPLEADVIVRSVEFSYLPTTGSSVAYLLVAALLPPAIVIACRIVRRGRLATRALVMTFGGAWALNAVAVLGLAGLGHSDAVDSYHMVAQIVRDADIVYAHTDRYNYGILWSYVVAALMSIHDALGLAGPETFHLFTSALVYGANITIGTILARAFNPIAGLTYALMPPLVLLNGFHGAFDPLALAPGLVAALIIASERRRNDTRWLVAAALLMFVSLVVKHWMAFFLPWILMWTPLGPFRRRLIFVTIVGGLFFLHFLPFAFDVSARDGIVNAVFLHQSGRADSIFSKIFKYGSPSAVYEALQACRALSLLWLGALFTLGWVFRHNRDGRFLAPVYLITFVAFAPTWADVYLGGPLVACAVLYRFPAAWLYVGTTTVTLLASPHNVAATLQPNAVSDFLLGTTLHRGDVHQFVLLLLLLTTFRDPWRESLSLQGAKVVWRSA